jgi:hypothetical protein
MGFEVPFNTTNECYTHDNIISNNNIKLENGEGEESETMKYSEYINNPKYFDKKNYSFDRSATDSNDAYKKCKERTEELNSDFFLVSDVSYANQEFYYNCYIPKNSQRCNTNTLQKLISPFEQVFNKMFGVDPDIFQGTSDISSIMRIGIRPQNIYGISYEDYATMDICSNNCFRNDNKVLLPKTNFFGIFYSKYLDINSNDANVDSYISQSIKTDISYIEENYTEDNLNGILTQLHSSLQNNICTNQDLPNIDAIDESIKRLDEFYNGGGDDPKYIGFINSLEQLGNDISNIGQSSKTNTKYLRAVDDLVKKSNSKLNNVLKLDGANNGKYNDTQYLKNQKISEIIVLMLIIIFLIFIYSKKK